ncbi:hypothetical protein BH11CYA1_BH11CYA1_06970 [soil metagenome]
MVFLYMESGVALNLLAVPVGNRRGCSFVVILAPKLVGKNRRKIAVNSP